MKRFLTAIFILSILLAVRHFDEMRTHSGMPMEDCPIGYVCPMAMQSPGPLTVEAIQKTVVYAIFAALTFAAILVLPRLSDPIAISPNTGPSLMRFTVKRE
jgi:hypothetical protein